MCFENMLQPILSYYDNQQIRKLTLKFHIAMLNCDIMPYYITMTRH